MTRLGTHALTILEKGCRREYALRYKVGRYWPAMEDPAARALEAAAPKKPDPRLGKAFHALVHQHAMAIDVAPALEAFSYALPDLEAVWGKFLASPYAAPAPGAMLWSEQALHAAIGEVPVSVVYDRVLREGDAWTIVDWKTGRPSARALADGWQARLYLWMLVEAGAPALAPGAAIAPGDVRLVFWDVSRGEPIAVGYDAEAHAATGARLRELARLAAQPFDDHATDDANFPASPRKCARCGFRDHCGLVRERLVRPAAGDRPARPRFVLTQGTGAP